MGMVLDRAMAIAAEDVAVGKFIYYGSLIFSEECNFLSGHIIPVDAHTNINTHKAANKADEIACHKAEP